MKTKKTYGLIGRNIAYSFSPDYFNSKFKTENIDAEYRLFDLENIDEIKDILAIDGLLGLNVTIPYKQEVIPFLDECQGIAQELNAVNTIALKDGKTIGYNTDVIGFKKSFETRWNPKQQSALILGTGGASLAVAAVMRQLGISYKMVSRQKEKGDMTYRELDKETIENHHIIINCTPLGTSPNTERCPDIPYSFLGTEHYCFDLIYNPATTEFLKRAKAQGANIQNGKDMLVYQAEAAWEIFG